jgi:hypothetical protein
MPTFYTDSDISAITGSMLTKVVIPMAPRLGYTRQRCGSNVGVAVLANAGEANL